MISDKLKYKFMLYVICTLKLLLTRARKADGKNSNFILDLHEFEKEIAAEEEAAECTNAEPK